MNPTAMEHLALANTNRLDRAKLRQQVRAGEVNPLDVLRDPPACAYSLPIGDFIRWAYLSDASAGRMLLRCQISFTTPLEDVTLREVAKIRIWLSIAHPAILKRWES